VWGRLGKLSLRIAETLRKARARTFPRKTAQKWQGAVYPTGSLTTPVYGELGCCAFERLPLGLPRRVGLAVKPVGGPDSEIGPYAFDERAPCKAR